MADKRPVEKMSTKRLYCMVTEYDNLKFRNDVPYIKHGNYWEPVNEHECYKYIFGVVNEKNVGSVSQYMVKDVLFKLRNSGYNELEFYDDTVYDYVNVNNGVFDTNTGLLLQKLNTQNFSYCLDFNYRTDVEEDSVKVFNKFISDTFPEDTEEKKKLLLETIGYAISDLLEAKALIIYLGKTNSGKSQILELVSSIIRPKCIVTTVPLECLGNKFNLASLFNSKLNVLTELNVDSFKCLDILKQLSASEFVMAEEKGKPPFSFRLRTKSLNASNVMPRITEVEGMQAILNRLVILRFPKSVAPENMDIHLLDKLKQEKDYIFSLALDELVRLKKNNFRFTEPQDSVELKAMYTIKANIIEEFIKDNCNFKKGARIHFSKLYERFNKYCVDNCLGDIKLTQSQFTLKILEMEGLTRKRFRVNGSRAYWGVEGLELLDDDKE